MSIVTFSARINDRHDLTLPDFNAAPQTYVTATYVIEDVRIVVLDAADATALVHVRRATGTDKRALTPEQFIEALDLTLAGREDTPTRV